MIHNAHETLKRSLKVAVYRQRMSLVRRGGSAFGALALLFAVCGISAVAYATRLQADDEKTGQTYYVDSRNGDDQSNGTNPNAAWRTFGNIKSRRLNPGDKVLLRRGCEWNEPLRPRGLGTERSPIEIGAYGEGAKPIVNGGREHAVASVEPISYWSIWGLELTSRNDLNPTHRIEGGTCGLFFKQRETCKNLTIRNCLIHDTSGPGIHLIATGQPTAVFIGTVIDHCEIHHASCGIQFHATPNFGPEFFEHCRIAHVMVHDIGGDGIVPFCSHDTMVEHCVAYRTGLKVAPEDHSPVAIWYAWAKNSVIQNCEAYDNYPGGKTADGGGFDLDGGCTDCVLQYNYSHDNRGAGYLICSWDPTTWPCTNNVCRYNLSVNDGLANDHAGLMFWMSEDCKVYNNTFVARKGPALRFLSETKKHIIANNIFYQDGPADLPVVKSEFNIDQNQFSHNLFFASTGRTRFVLPGHDFQGLDQWKKQARSDRDLIADPRFVNLKGGDAHLLPDSPCLNAGERIRDSGKRDFFNAVIDFAKNPNIGCAGTRTNP